MRQILVSWAATSCFLILAVIALRAALGKRMDAGLRYALWGLVLVRLLVPVQLFTSPVLGTVIDSEKIITKETSTVQEVLDAPGGQDSTQAAAGGTVFPAAPTMPDPPAVPDAPDWTELPAHLGWVWLAGSAAAALVLAGCNLKFYLRLRKTRRPLTADGYGGVLPVYVADGLPSPCLFGVRQPAIYVTPEAAADPAMLRHVLTHEQTHCRHGDNIWNLFRCAALCVHWWNPLVWLAARLSQRDGELACDEGALKLLGDSERTAYGNTLLALVTAKPSPGGLLTCATTMAGDKKSLTERVSRIARAPKRAAGVAAAAVLLAALVTVCAFGQKSEALLLAPLDAELACTVNRDGTVVRITGTVDGLELPRGAFWYPDALLSGAPDGELSWVYPPFTGGIEGQLSAWWADEEHTAVNLSTRMMAALSSYWPSGYWEFTVDLSGSEAVVTRMESIAAFPEDMEVQMHPKTISDGEAIRAGRIAARLLTAAETSWQNFQNSTAAPVTSEKPSEPPAPPEVPADARSALKAALLGEVDFTLYDREGQPATVDISSAPHTAFPNLTEDYNERYNDFTVVDLDGDGTAEAVIQVMDVAGDNGGYLVLRWAGPGDIRCYIADYRTFWDLKTDGTFLIDRNYESGYGWGRMSFPAPGNSMVMDTIAVGDYAGNGTFTVEGESVTLEQFKHARKIQDEKEDMFWWDFEEQYILQLLG